MTGLQRDDNYRIELEGYIAWETEQAILFDDGTVQAWLPKSMIESEDDISAGNDDLVTIEIPEWLAEEKELV